MIKFTKERILLLYQMIVEATGGTFGIRSEELLESAIEAPYQTFDGNELVYKKIVHRNGVLFLLDSSMYVIF